MLGINRIGQGLVSSVLGYCDGMGFEPYRSSQTNDLKIDLYTCRLVGIEMRKTNRPLELALLIQLSGQFNHGAGALIS